MDKNILLEKLQAIGLTKNEARVYLAALEVGTSPASGIAEAAHMNRVSAYGILKKLLKRGMMTTNEQRGVQYFIAMDPQIFIENVKQKAFQLESMLPALQSLIGEQSLHPTVQFFEGLEAVKNAYKISLSAKTDILNYANSKNIRDHWPDYNDTYVSERKAKKIFLKGLAPDDAQGRDVRNSDEKYFRETRLIEKKHFQVENEIKIFDDKLFIASFEPSTFAILIESQAVADTQRKIFEIAWGFAKTE